MTTETNVPTVVLGVTLDEQARALLSEGKETELIKGFISQKTGKPFDAYLKIGASGSLKFRFPERETKKKKTTKDTIPKVVGGVKLDEEDLENLKAGRETKLIEGMLSKKTGKTYDAYLKWHKSKGIIFRFLGQDWVS